MKIKVEENEIKVVGRGGYNHIFNYGYLSIDETGFQAVDNVTETLIKHVEADEDVFVESNGDVVAAKMIQRKMEDKIKREVTLISL